MTTSTALKTVARSVAVRGLYTAARAKVRSDQRGATHTSQRLLAVISRWFREDYTDQDSAWFHYAEQQCELLLTDRHALTKVDYGAGGRDEALAGTLNALKSTTIGDVCAQTSKTARWAKLLYALVSEYQPAHALELGTSVGVSAIYQGGALQRFGGHLTTIEGAPEVAAVAQQAIDRAGLHDITDILVGRFGDVLPSLLASSEPLNYMFVDGHHDQHATIEYHNMIKPRLAPGAILVYDDIHWSPGMEHAWSVIQSDPDLCSTVDLTAVGVAVLGEDAKQAFRYQLRGVT